MNTIGVNSLRLGRGLKLFNNNEVYKIFDENSVMKNEKNNKSEQMTP